MKEIIISMAAISLLSACQQSKEILSSPDEVRANDIMGQSVAFQNSLSADYQLFSPHVQFTPAADGSYAIEAQREFIIASGLPMEADAAAYVKSHSLADAMDAYRMHISSNGNHPYLSTFRQYGGWLLLTRYAMLGDNNPTRVAQVQYVLDQLVGSRYSGFGLQYYCLQYLQYAGLQVQSTAQAVVANKAAIEKQDLALQQSAPKGQQTRELSPGAKELIEKHMAEKEKDAAYLDKIASMTK